MKLVEEHLGFPVIVKTLAGTQGAGVCLVKDADGLEDLFRFAQAAGISSPTILQQFIAIGSVRGKQGDTDTGADIELLVFDDERLGLRHLSKGVPHMAPVPLLQLRHAHV